MLSATLWLALGSSEAIAADPESASNHRNRPMEVVTVEASKLPLAREEITTRVTVIDTDRIASELAQSIDELVRYEPGVDVANQGSRFGLSGFNIRGIGGNRVQIEVDGVATSSAFSIGSFSNASRDFVDVEGLKQVEIIRGPASALFGSDALGGVVSFVTRGPYDYLGADERYADASAGFNSVDGSTMLSGTGAMRLGNGALLLRGTARSGSERDTPGADPFEDDSLNLLMRYTHGDPAAGGLDMTLERFQARSETEVDSLETVQDFTAAFGFPYVIDTQTVRGDDERTRTRISVGQEWLGGAFGTDYLRWRAYYQDSETLQQTFESRTSLIAGSVSAVDRDRSFSFSQSLAGFEVNAASEFSLGFMEHQLAYGVEFESADTTQLRDGTETDLATGETSSQVGPDLFPLRDFPMSTTRRTGVYLQDRVMLGSLTLVPGVRWDRFTLSPDVDTIFTEDNPGIETVSLDESQVSPKVGVLYDIGDRWQAFGQYSEGFRAPPVNDVNVGFTNLQFGYTTLPNPELESESSEGFELGLRFGGERLQWELSAFATRYDNFIESFRQVGFDPVNQLLQFQSVNVDEVRIQGAELQGHYRPAFLPDGFSLHLSAAHADGENQATGAPINTVSPLNGVLGVEYDAPGRRWGVRLLGRGATGVDELDEGAGELIMPAGYVVYDTISYFRPTPRTRLRAGLYNLADREYTAFLDVAGIPAGGIDPARFQSPGRQFSLAFDWTF